MMQVVEKKVKDQVVKILVRLVGLCDLRANYKYCSLATVLLPLACLTQSTATVNQIETIDFNNSLSHTHTHTCSLSYTHSCICSTSQ